MYYKELRVEIDESVIQPITAKQKDSARYLNINITNNQLPYDLTGCNVRWASKANVTGGKVEMFDAKIVNYAGGRIQVHLNQDILANAGLVSCELIIFKGVDIISTISFNMTVRPSIWEGATDTTEYNTLVGAMRDVDKAVETTTRLQEDYDEVEQSYGHIHEMFGGNKSVVEVVAARPPCTSPLNKNSWKIAHKTSEKEMFIYQAGNDGTSLRHTFVKNIGVSGGTNYGKFHERIRLVKTKDTRLTYLWFDPINAVIEADRSKLLESMENVKYNTCEKRLAQIRDVDGTVYDGSDDTGSNDGFGIFGYRIKDDCTFDVPLTSSKKGNVMLDTRMVPVNPEVTSLVTIKVNGRAVRTVDLKSFQVDTGGTFVTIDFEVPYRVTTETPYKVTIEVPDNSSYVILMALNFFTLQDYDGAHVDSFKALSTPLGGFIDNIGASDFAATFKDESAPYTVVGSYHGGEQSLTEAISWLSVDLPSQESIATKKQVAWDAIPVGQWVVVPEFTIRQQTDVAEGRGLMNSETSFQNDGTIDMDFSWKGTPGLEFHTFYTALTCTHASFTMLCWPHREVTNLSDGTYHYGRFSEGKVVQQYVTGGLEITHRFTTFGNSLNSRPQPFFIADASIYRKSYYGPIYQPNNLGIAYKIPHMSFSKSLDFRILSVR